MAGAGMSVTGSGRSRVLGRPVCQQLPSPSFESAKLCGATCDAAGGGVNPKVGPASS